MVGVLCVAVGAVSAAPPAAYINVILNPSFTAGFSNWSVFGGTVWDVDSAVLLSYAPSSPSDIQQDISFSASAGDKYEIVFSAGNSSDASKSLQVQLYNGIDSTGWIICTFSVAANTSMQSYRMRGVVGAAWASMRFRLRYQNVSSDGWLMLDNISAHLSPGSQHTTTICDSPPAPTPTPTPTPQLYTEYEISEGNAARVENTVTAGDYTIIIILFVLLVSFWGVFILRELRGVSK